MHITSSVMLSLPVEGDECTVMAKMPPVAHTQVEAVGRWFEAYCVRRRHKQTLSYHSLNSSSSEESDGELSEEDEDDESLLRSLDPKEWKNQDHYSVLGLGKLRGKATDDQIKRAYKKKVLKHHPDKRRARGLAVKEGDDDYFTCITRSYEVLGIPVKRRSYDSVDPEFEDAVPSANQESKDKFYETFQPVFEANARWTSKRNVPKLGDKNSTFEEVNNFYSFWYDFDSWREYSYLDEEEKEKGENRDERRWIEKQNKAARQKRKKEEVIRIRTLTDNAYACDPRIVKFKDDEKARKQAQKQAKRDVVRQRQEEEERKRQEIIEAERKKKEAEEGEAKAQAAAVKKEKDAQKKVIKKERKLMRTKLKELDYFATDDTERVNYMQEVEKLVELLSLASLQELNEDLIGEDTDKAKQSFLDKVKEVNEEMAAEITRNLVSSSKKASGVDLGAAVKNQWPEEELALLVKGVNLFPAGTVQRWDTIGNFIHQHMEDSNRSAKEVLTKAKELQKMDMSFIKEATNKNAYDRYEKTHHASAATDKSEESKRYDSVAVQQIGETGSNPSVWTAEEQKLLEQALRTYPASVEERWEKISAVLPSRSKKDCMKRYKELVDMVRAKKAATAATKKK